MTKPRRSEKPRLWDVVIENSARRNREIVRRHRAGASQSDLARAYRISRQRVSAILKRAAVQG